MSDKTGISWTDATWNPIRGCSRVSEGCRNCYAERVAARFSGPGQPYDGLIRLRRRAGAEKQHADGWSGMVRLVGEHLADPLKWRKPRRIFVNSMSDLFHESLTNEQIAAVFGVMAAAPHHTFQVLTKRSMRMREWFTWVEADPVGSCIVPMSRCIGHARVELGNGTILGFKEPQWPLPNVWLGVSVEHQAAADERIPELLRTPAAVRFLSCEPLIGEVHLDLGRCDDPYHGPSEWSISDNNMPWCNECDQERSFGHWLRCDDGIDWVIAGCESGPGARPAEVAWFRSLRDQCAAAKVPFFLKQAVLGGGSGSLAAFISGAARMPGIWEGPGSKRKPGRIIELPYLDGVQHAAFP